MVAATLAVVVLAGVAAVAGLRWAHFVGADETTGRVAIYQGLPFDLCGGLKLYREVAADQRRLRLARPGDAQAAVRPHAPLGVQRARRRRESPAVATVRSARFRELTNLLASR